MKASEKLQQLRKQVAREFENLEASEFFEKIPGVIRERTRQGHSLSGGDLPKLAPSTIDRRLSLDRNGKLSGKTTPFFSNLTESGKTLDALTFKKIGKKYSIGFDDRRSRNGVKPSEIKDFVEEKGFKFFGLRRVEAEELQKKIADKLSKAIARIFKL